MRPDLSRKAGWRGRFAAVVHDWQSRPFAPGVTDCGLFAAACVEAITGEDLAAEWRHAYTSEEEARDLMKSRGLASPLALARATLPAIAPARMIPGDVVVLPRAPGYAGGFAVCQGRCLLAVAPLSGLTALPRRAARWAFAVGDH